MSFRFHRGLAALSIFHNASSPPSRAALQLLQSALTGRFPTPSSPPLTFNLEIVETPPTATQLTSISSYLGRPLSELMSAHPSGGNATATGAAEMSRLFENKNAMKYPVVVNWDDGEAAVGDVESVRKLLAKLAAKQHGSPP